MSLFEQTYDVVYRFLDKDGVGYYDSLRRIGERRVPNIGESIDFICRGGRNCEVVDIKTNLTHDPSKCTYIVTVKRIEDLSTSDKTELKWLKKHKQELLDLPDSVYYTDIVDKLIASVERRISLLTKDEEQ